MASVRATATGTQDSGTSLVITKPTGTVDGDVMVAGISHLPTSTITPPAGWSTLVTAAAPFDSAVSVFRRVASSEGADYTFTASASHAFSGAIVTAQNPHATTPEDGSAATGNTPGDLTPGVDAPSISPATTTALLLTFYCSNSPPGASDTFTVPGGQTEEADACTASGANQNHAIAVGSEALAASGATGTRTATYSRSSRTWAAASVAVRDVAAAAVHRSFHRQMRRHFSGL